MRAADQASATARLAGANPLPSADAPDADFRRWLGRSGPQRLGPLARIDLAAARANEEGLSGRHGAAAEPQRDPKEVVAAYRRARTIRRTAPPLAVGDLAFDGRDLLGLGLPPGPVFGRILERLLEWVLDDPGRNERTLLEAEARRIVDSGEVEGG